MHKTTIYLPQELKLALEQTAASRGQSVSEGIRDALRTLLASAPPPRPRVPLFTSGLPGVADRVEGSDSASFPRTAEPALVKLEVDHVSKRYAIPILNEVSFRVTAGEFVCVQRQLVSGRQST